VTQPPAAIWIGRYALMVSILMVIFLALALLLTGFSGYRILVPAMDIPPEEFTYELATGGSIFLGLTEEHIPLFDNISESQFEKQKDLLYGIAKEDYPKGIVRAFLEGVAQLLLYSLVLVVHYRLWKRYRRGGV